MDNIKTVTEVAVFRARSKTVTYEIRRSIERVMNTARRESRKTAVGYIQGIGAIPPGWAPLLTGYSQKKLSAALRIGMTRKSNTPSTGTSKSKARKMSSKNMVPTTAMDMETRKRSAVKPINFSAKDP